MHISGKILIWVIALTVLAAIGLTSKMVVVRNSWTRKLETLKKQSEENSRQLAEQRDELDSLQKELNRTLIGWGRYWNNVETGLVERETGKIQVPLGTNTDLTTRTVQAEDGSQSDVMPVIHAFQAAADGGSQYVGAFQATTLEQNRAGLQPTWNLRDGEVDRWQPGQWRFRRLIPSSYSNVYSDLRSQLTLADELLDAKQTHLETQQELHEIAEQHLQYRLGELLGTDQPSDDQEMLPVLADGLVATIEREEQIRNEELADVDEFRRKIRERRQRLEELVTINKRLVSSLPQPPQAATAEVSSN